jgi:chromosome segregation ATPase
MVDSHPLSDRAGRKIMPPTSSSLERVIGGIEATLREMTKRDEEDRAEGRERSRKIDHVLDRMSTLDLQVRDGLRHMEEKLQSQSRGLEDKLSSFKHEQAQEAQIARGSLHNLKTQIEEFKAVQAEAQTAQAQMRTQIAAISTDVASVKTDVAAVKGDTAKLQGPVGQFVSIRAIVLSWSAAAVSVVTFLFFIFRKQWDELVSHIFNLLFS